MRALSSRPFCSCDSRRVSLWDLSAGLRYTTHGFQPNASGFVPLSIAEFSL
jgi:hypothetical protein